MFILSWERPIYLWVTLDSLFRHTRHPAKFIMIDNGSTDPLVRKVIRGFERRAMLSEVIYAPENKPSTFPEVVAARLSELPEFFAFVEGDVEVLRSKPDWLTEMVSLMQEHPDLAYLGSLIDPQDFVPLGHCHTLGPAMEENRLRALIKAHSPERSYPQEQLERVNFDLQPPGRLCLYRTAALAKVPIQPDGQFTVQVRAHGMKAGIATRVRHRHLSLLHLFDEQDYDVTARDVFFQRMFETL